MSIDSVGYVDFYHATATYDPKNVANKSTTNSIFAEKETKKHNAAKTVATVAGLATAAVLAYVFRGKIKAGGTKVLDTVKPYLEKVTNYIKNTKVAQKVTPLIEKAGNTIKTNYTKVATWLKGIIKK